MPNVLHALAPVFDFETNPFKILLSSGTAKLVTDKGPHTCAATASLDLLSHAGVRFHAAVPCDSAFALLATEDEMRGIREFEFNGTSVPGFWTKIDGRLADGHAQVVWCPKHVPVIGVGSDSTQVAYVVFHLFNFVDLLGMRRSSERKGTTQYAIEHVDLVSGDWRIELKSLPTRRSAFKSLEAEGGYQLTHVGSLEKVNGTSFSGEDAAKCLSALRFFLSFAKGGWCDPACAVGFDSAGARVWESWSSPTESWHTPSAWFDAHSSAQLASLFPCFMARWADNDWREALHEVIYWYVNGNNSSRGIDAGIILTQAAIERLSYEFAVEDKRLITGNGFKDLWASDKFRLLFSSLGIPLDIPAETSELQKLAGQMNWLDAPHAITEIRNSLVHPEHKHRGQFGSAIYEAWNLGLWYLEMGILAICGYSGTYGNRLKHRSVGQVEDVPWK